MYICALYVSYNKILDSMNSSIEKLANNCFQPAATITLFMITVHLIIGKYFYILVFLYPQSILLFPNKQWYHLDYR